MKAAQGNSDEHIWPAVRVEPLLPDRLELAQNRARSEVHMVGRVGELQPEIVSYLLG